MYHWLTGLLAAMKSKIGRLLVGPIIAAVLLALLLAANVAADTTPATYYACVNQNNGTIRMTTANGTCNGNETKISWNQVGPAGPQGPAGATGPQGPQGPQGPAGLTQHLTLLEADSEEIIVPPGASRAGVAVCPTGSFAITGGVRVVGGIDGYYNFSNGNLSSDASSWAEYGTDEDTAPTVLVFKVFVSCLSLTS